MMGHSRDDGGDDDDDVWSSSAALHSDRSGSGTLRDTHPFPDTLCTDGGGGGHTRRGEGGRDAGWAEDTIITTGSIVWCTTLTHSLAHRKLASHPRPGLDFRTRDRRGVRRHSPLRCHVHTSHRGLSRETEGALAAGRNGRAASPRDGDGNTGGGRNKRR